jgi:hypothetical protein
MFELRFNFLDKFNKRVGPLRRVQVLQAVTAHYEETGNEQGLLFIEEVRGSRELKEAFFDEIAGLMTARQFAAAPKADGEFLKWLIEFIIANLPAIIAMFTT